MTIAREGGSLAGPIARPMTWQKHSLVKVVEQIPTSVVVTLPEGMIEYVNSRLRRLLGEQGSRLD